MTGNKRTQKINGRNLQMLIFYRIIWPCASGDEIRAFMLRNGSNILFSRQDISLAETIIQLTPKVVSTTALQAFEPHQQMRQQLFWTRGPPVGVWTVPVNDLVDLDECGFGLGVVNRTKGKSFNGVIIRNPGPSKYA